MCWGSQIHGGVTCLYFASVSEAPHSSVRKRTYQAVAGVLRAYRAGVTLGFVRTRAEIVVSGHLYTAAARRSPTARQRAMGDHR